MTRWAAAALALGGVLIPAGLSAQSAGPSTSPRAGIEVAALAGVAGTSPEVGALVSLPIGTRVSIDAGASYLARVFRSPAFLLAQAQLRIPFRPSLRSRYSLLVGVTRLEALDRRDGDSPLWRDDVRSLFPHAGASLQWPLGGVDLRVDAQLVVQGAELMPIVPRVSGGISWPTRARPSATAAP